ncbi:hypothetical protein GCM10011348_45680 [Marinobacterium nitratireducens]|uniref:Uncharacterized protein n=1 Tax=Marinobacterium nitratireducens TaxID=518897 RepID=A0A918DYJ1_9GAMM|nr:hypothetical protein [Marinobacterium nitratireducens]GGO88985.1 hypothetical protein GCM10011348_45680 [Marinobacterium nitratireducens]
MSPEKLLEIAERVEARIYPEFNTTTDPARWRYCSDQIDRACVLRICSHLKRQGLPLPSIRRRR